MLTGNRGISSICGEIQRNSFILVKSPKHFANVTSIFFYLNSNHTSKQITKLKLYKYLSDWFSHKVPEWISLWREKERDLIHCEMIPFFLASPNRTVKIQKDTHKCLLCLKRTPPLRCHHSNCLQTSMRSLYHDNLLRFFFSSLYRRFIVNVWTLTYERWKYLCSSLSPQTFISHEIIRFAFVSLSGVKCWKLSPNPALTWQLKPISVNLYLERTKKKINKNYN